MADWNTFLRQLYAAGVVVAILFVIAIAAILVLVGIALYRLDQGARELAPTLTDARRTILVLGGAATNLEKTLALERQAASSQIAIGQQAAESLKRATAAAELLMRSTNEQLNGNEGLLPAATEALVEQTASITILETQARQNLEHLDDIEKDIPPAIANFSRASASLADSLPPILDNVNVTSAHVAGTTESLEASAHDIQAFIHRETAPVRGTWNVIKEFLVTFAGPAAQVATAAK